MTSKVWSLKIYWQMNQKKNRWLLSRLKPKECWERWFDTTKKKTGRKTFFDIAHWTRPSNILFRRMNSPWLEMVYLKWKRQNECWMLMTRVNIVHSLPLSLFSFLTVIFNLTREQIDPTKLRSLFVIDLRNINLVRTNKKRKIYSRTTNERRFILSLSLFLYLTWTTQVVDSLFNWTRNGSNHRSLFTDYLSTQEKTSIIDYCWPKRNFEPAPSRKSQ